MDAICVLFLLCQLLKSSFLSVVFDFNASLNDVAPVPSICLPVDVIQHKYIKRAFFLEKCVS